MTKNIKVFIYLYNNIIISTDYLFYKKHLDVHLSFILFFIIAALHSCFTLKMKLFFGDVHQEYQLFQSLSCELLVDQLLLTNAFRLTTRKGKYWESNCYVLHFWCTTNYVKDVDLIINVFIHNIYLCVFVLFESFDLFFSLSHYFYTEIKA